MEVYDNFLTNYSDSNYITSRAILAPTNYDVDKINEFCTEKLPGFVVIKNSADFMKDDKSQKTKKFHVSTDVLNKFSEGGLPHHKLVLKIGMPLILLRNVNSSIKDLFVSNSSLYVL